MRRFPAVLLAAVQAGLLGAGCGSSRVPVEATAGGGWVPRAATAQATAAGFAGIFPFTSQAELDAYTAGADQTYRSPVRTAREFATSYLGFSAPELDVSDFRPAGAGAGEVSIGTRRTDRVFVATVVALRQLGAGGESGPWTVVGAASPEILVDQPRAQDRVSSPLTVSGRGRAFEATISLEMREDGMLFGQNLGRSRVMGGATEVLPFSGSFAFAAPSRAGGALLFQDRSGIGPPDAVNTTVVRVLFRSVVLTG